MLHAAAMLPSLPAAVSVIDFRRRSMILEWQPPKGTWAACDDPPIQVHGIALIRASQPNVCVYGWGGQLHLQVGLNQCPLTEASPQLKFARTAASLGLLRRFSVKAGPDGTSFNHAYWRGQGDEFFYWLTQQAADPHWRTATGRLWTDGVEAAVLRPA